MHETIELLVALVDLGLEKGVNQVKSAYFVVLMPLSGKGALASSLTDQTLCKTFFYDDACHYRLSTVEPR